MGIILVIVEPIKWQYNECAKRRENVCQGGHLFALVALSSSYGGVVCFEWLNGKHLCPAEKSVGDGGGLRAYTLYMTQAHLLSRSVSDMLFSSVMYRTRVTVNIMSDVTCDVVCVLNHFQVGECRRGNTDRWHGAFCTWPVIHSDSVAIKNSVVIEYSVHRFNSVFYDRSIYIY